MKKLKELLLVVLFVPLIMFILGLILFTPLEFLRSLAHSNCEPDWVMPTPVSYSRIYVEKLPEDMPQAMEVCKSICYNWYDVTSFKLEELSLHTYQCYCDINNCNPQ